MTVVRGPQQARSHATHARLIEATVECLVRQGYAGTSTQAVAQAAGVSQGALFKHFPSKAELLGAAVAHLLASLVGAFRLELGRRFGGAGGAFGESGSEGLGGLAWPMGERVGPAVGALWAVFRSAELGALLGVYVAARTDPVLEARLGPALAVHNEHIVDEARRLFPEVAARPEFEGAIGAVVYAMQGAVVGLFGPAARDDAANLAFFERLARRELGALFGGEAWSLFITRFLGFCSACCSRRSGRGARSGAGRSCGARAAVRRARGSSATAGATRRRAWRWASATSSFRSAPRPAPSR